jgi:hypothetical protein
MMPKTAEEGREYNKAYYQANKEKIAEQKRAYREANKKRIAERDKSYREANKERLAEQRRAYRASNPESDLVARWQRRGVISDNFPALHKQYLAATQCEDCGVGFGTYGDGTGTHRCLDHCHATGAFRGVVCHGCNLKRGP